MKKITETESSNYNNKNIFLFNNLMKKIMIVLIIWEKMLILKKYILFK